MELHVERALLFFRWTYSKSRGVSAIVGSGHADTKCEQKDTSSRELVGRPRMMTKDMREIYSWQVI